MRHQGWGRVFCALILLAGGLAGSGASFVVAVASEAHRTSPWNQLVEEARAMGLPVRFLESIPADFVAIEFEDLHTYAAEYHPEDHRMVLNRTLSFNAAGSVLRPLRTLHHRDVGTLFHELFHAYMDYLVADPSATARDESRQALLAFARDRQGCRYTQVQITPVVQRRAATEPRELSDRESWEALNETWAVFIGWAVWTKLEAADAAVAQRKPRASWDRDWFARLQRANERGELRGYYEPEDFEERALTKKRYLSLAFRIAPDEAKILMASVMEVPVKAARSVEQLLAWRGQPLDRGQNCQPYPIDISKNGAPRSGVN